MGEKVHNEMANYAYQLVASLNQSDDRKKCAAEFRSLSRSFPSMIQVNGLGGAIAYLYSKKSEEKSDKKKQAFECLYLYEAIDKWTLASLEGGTENDEGNAAGTELAQRIFSLNSREYRLYTNEVMNLCLWIKRFAEGMLSV